MHSINEDLKNKRLALNMSVDTVAERLNIRPKYITAIEEENYNLIPGKVYIEGYVRLYANFLGIEFNQPQFLRNIGDHQLNIITKPDVISNKPSLILLFGALISILLLTYGWSKYLIEPFSEKSDLTRIPYINLGNDSFITNDYVARMSYTENNLSSVTPIYWSYEQKYQINNIDQEVKKLITTQAAEEVNSDSVAPLPLEEPFRDELVPVETKTESN